VSGGLFESETREFKRERERESSRERERVQERESSRERVQERESSRERERERERRDLDAVVSVFGNVARVFRDVTDKVA